MFRRYKHLHLLTATLSLAVLTGCPDDDDPLPPSIDVFTSSATSVDAGGTVTLNWVVSDATSIELAANDTVVVADAEATGMFVSAALTADTTFKLTAANGFGDSSRSITVTVNGGATAPTVDSFVASPETIEVGDSATLSWETTGASTIDIMAGDTVVVADGDADGQTTVSPTETTTYTLVATGADGQTAMAMATITIDAPAAPTIASFMANPAAVDPGNSSTLSWNVMGATSIEITGGGATFYSGAEAMGTQAVTPEATLTYTLTATNDVGSSTETVTVTVNPPQGASVQAFTANPSTVMIGQGADLSWMTTNADSVEIMAGGVVLHTSAMNAGTFTVTPTTSTDYTLMAYNPAGDAMATTTVTVNASAPFIRDFSGTPNPGPIDGTVILSWDVLGADTVRVLDGTTELANTMMNTGTVAVTLTSTMTVYTLEVANVTGGNSSMLTVYGHNPPGIEVFSASAYSFTGTSTIVTLSWDTANVQNLGIMMNGAPLAGFTPIANTGFTTDEAGSVDVMITGDATFTLNVDSAAGAVSATIDIVQAIAEAEPNDDAANAIALAMGGTVNGAIDVSGDEDWYTVDVPAGGWVRAETSDGLGGCNGDSKIELYAPDGTTRLLLDDDGGNSVCSLIDPLIDAEARNLAAGTYYVRVIPYSSSTNPFGYQLSVEAGAPMCGNRIPETAEQCDDGNTVSGDGCDGSCNVEPVATYTAPAAPSTYTNAIAVVGEQDYFQVVVTAPTLLTVETFVDAAAGTCSGPDTRLTLLDSSFTVLGTDDYDGVSSCSRIDPATDTWAQLAPGTYYVRVEEDGNNSTVATYDVVFDGLGANVCGNGIVEAGNNEVCDDGNTLPGDGCSATCQPEAILDYTAPGPLASVTSSLTATQVDTVRITATSTVYILAETIVDPVARTCSGVDTRIRLRDSNGTELGSDDYDGVDSCSRIKPTDSWALVGPGVYFLTIEEDGMDATISDYTLEVIGVPVNICGNGVVEAGINEMCDDGNTIPGDGCDATCQQEILATYTAPGAPASVTEAIAYPGQQDVYEIVVTAETYLEVETFEDANAGTCTFDTYLRLYDSTLTQIGTDDDDGVDRCSYFGAGDGFARLVPGTYFAVVEEYNNDGTIPSYDIVFQSNPVDVCGNGVVDGTGEACDDGNTVAGDGCDASCQLEGNFVSETEPNGDIATANASGLSAVGLATVTGLIDLGNDLDYWAFDVPAGGATLHAITYGTPGSPSVCGGLDTKIYLYDSTGAELDQNDDIGFPNYCSELANVALTAGTYYIRVQYYSSFSDPSSPFTYFMDIELQ